MSEIGKYRHLCAKYCYTPDGQPGVGLDVASQGDPIVPWAFQLDLPPEEFAIYSGGRQPQGIQLYGHAERLPIASKSLDFLASSHFIEDIVDWEPVLAEWKRVVKVGGHIIINLPDKVRWNYAVQVLGQPPNCAHRHESYPGELSTYAPMFGWEVIEDRLTECHPNDYNILFVARVTR